MANDDHFDLAELIFSCSICQATVSDVYASVESNHGFHSGSGDEEGIVNKMWIAGCSHVTCAKHLQNGAAPFHPKDMPPQMQCPRCVQEKSDDTLKPLFAIRGLQDGECDAAIPAEWRTVPGAKLDSSSPAMEALRFQYMALAHYARQVRKHWKGALVKQSTNEDAYAKERKQRLEVQREVQQLKARIDLLEKSEAKLQRWQSRQPEIEHYLHMFGPMAADYDNMRLTLEELGYQVPANKYTFDARDHAKAGQVHHHNESGSQVHPNGIDGGREKGDTSSGRKRKREDHTSNAQEQQNGHNLHLRSDSRDMMPPPLPNPKLPRQLVAAPDHVPSYSRQRPPSSRQNVQVYEDSAWKPKQIEDQALYNTGILQPYSNQRGRQPLGELPFRPLSTQSNQPTYLQHDHAFTDRSQRRIDANPTRVPPDVTYDDQPASRASPHLPQTRRTSNPQPTQRTSINTEGHAERPEEGNFEPRYHQPAYAPSRAPLKQFRPPLQTLSNSHQNRQPLFKTSIGVQPATPSPQRSSQAQGATVISAFFRGPTTHQPSTVQSPPTREQNFTQNRLGVSQLDGRANTNRNLLPTYEDARSQADVPWHNSPSQQSSYRLDTTARQRRESAAPQTPRNHQGLFQRPDRATPAASYVSSRPQPNTVRSRVSFPPNARPLHPVAESQDAALSQIHGVRGVTSHREMTSYQRPAQLHSAPRGLFSSAGGRRSVRR